MLLPILIAVVVLVLAVLAVAVWIGSTRVYREGLRHELPRRPILARVLEVSADSVVLRAASKRRLKREGTWGLSWPGGSARVADAEPVSDERGDQAGALRYALSDRRGELAVGDECELEAAIEVMRDGPDAAVEITYPTPMGDYPGRLVPGTGSTWLVVVHGQSNTARVQLRLLDVVSTEAAPAFAISYRNDPGTPPTPDGNFHFGRTEWADLDAAVEYAVDQGATRIVLVAESMGAAIALWFMRNSTLADRVDGLFFDAPVLDFKTAVNWVARTSGFPKPLVGLARELAARRFAIDWSRYDARPILGELSVPVLIVHGERDGQLPVTLSAEAAEVNPETVTLERFAGAGHCQSWNVDPARYEALLAGFVRDVSSVEAAPA